jgi:tRNA threonylcarbamoyladenosine biosynthesis protein TsaB
MKSPLVLAAETSTGVGSAALTRGQELLCQSFFEPDRGHGGVLLEQLDAVLSEAGHSVREVALFAAGAGPGSFTGVRVGISTLQAMAWATGRPMTALGSLWVLAQNQRQSAGWVAPLLDARRQEVYGALYKSDGEHLEEIIPASVAAPEQWLESVRAATAGRDTIFLGSGVMAYPKIFSQSNVDHRLHAAHLAKLAAALLQEGGADSLPDAKARYVRPCQAEVKFGAAPAHNPVDNVDPKASI